MQRVIAFVLAEVPGGARKGNELTDPKPLQNVPHYYSSAVPPQFLVEKKGKFVIKAYRPNILLVEVTEEVEDIFSPQTFTLREQLVDECQKIVRQRKGSEVLSEEYALAVVDHYEGDPDQFFARGSQMVSFLKSEPLALDDNEIRYALESQMKYAKNDLILVDWDGAFIFEPSGQVEAIVELFQVANLQLLQYRMLDGDLDERLCKVEKLIAEEAKFFNAPMRRRALAKAFKQVIEVRAKSIVQFDILERDIKLIGDWYSARLYELIAKKLRLEEWRRRIREKLDAIEDVYGIVAENFSISTRHYLEMIQIWLFFILQIGWFVLIVLEFVYFTRK